MILTTTFYIVRTIEQAVAASLDPGRLFPDPSADSPVLPFIWRKPPLHFLRDTRSQAKRPAVLELRYTGDKTLWEVLAQLSQDVAQRQLSDGGRREVWLVSPTIFGIFNNKVDLVAMYFEAPDLGTLNESLNDSA